MPQISLYKLSPKVDTEHANLTCYTLCTSCFGIVSFVSDSEVLSLQCFLLVFLYKVRFPQDSNSLKIA